MPDAAEREIRRIAAEPENQIMVLRGWLAYWSAYYGYPELAFEYFQQFFDPRADQVGLSVPWRSVFREMRRLPAFKELLREHGYVDYWQEYGWGDFCRPTVGDDFECE